MYSSMLTPSGRESDCKHDNTQPMNHLYAGDVNLNMLIWNNSDYYQCWKLSAVYTIFSGFFEVQKNSIYLK